MEEYEQEVVWRVYTARQSTVCEREDIIIGKGEYEKEAVVGKHPDLLVGPPTSTVFLTNDRNFERSQFSKKFSKRFKPKHRPKSRHLFEIVK